MERRTLGWTVGAVGTAIVLVYLQSDTDPSPQSLQSLLVVAVVLIVYALWLIIFPARPRLRITAESPIPRGVGGKWIDIPLTVVVYWDREVQLDFTLEVGEARLSSGPFRREHGSRRTYPGTGYLPDIPAQFKPGMTGPRKASFKRFDLSEPFPEVAMLEFKSTLPRLARGTVDVPGEYATPTLLGWLNKSAKRLYGKDQ